MTESSAKIARTEMIGFQNKISYRLMNIDKKKKKSKQNFVLFLCGPVSHDPRPGSTEDA